MKGKVGLVKEKAVPSSPVSKKFGVAKVSKKTFGFGKKPAMGMKGRPLNYGSA